MSQPDRSDTIHHARTNERILPLIEEWKMPHWMLAIFAVTSGMGVANVYYAQPLLESMAHTFGIAPGKIGAVVAATQVGYALGLVLIVPVGDIVDRRKLTICLTFLSSIALTIVGFAPDASILFAGMMAVGVLAVVAQVLVSTTASLARPGDRGRAVGLVTSGIVAGILSARLFSGVIADLGGWRMVYLSASCLMLMITGVLIRVMPHLPVTAPASYGKALRSIPELFMQEPVFRIRATYAFLIFASFSTLWTAMVLPLTASPFEMSHATIGLFGLVGLAGALASSSAGRMSDRGWEKRVTLISVCLLTISWVFVGFLHSSLMVFTIGVVLLDFAVQATHVTSMTMIFKLRPDARSRLIGGYMAFYSAGSAVGAIFSTAIYSAFGWIGVSILGAAFGLAAVLVWAGTEGRSAGSLSKSVSQ